MPWQGYNFEDSILITERIAKDDVFTSIHIEEFECVARDTKLGKEEITRDIPNVGEEALKDLDDARHRAHRRRGEAGRHPGRQDHAEGRDASSRPEEKLLRAIFGEKAGDVRDSSLGPAGRRRHRDQRPHLLAQGHREGRARARDIEDHERARLETHARRGDQDPPRLVLPQDPRRCSSARRRPASSSTTRARSCSQKGAEHRRRRSSTRSRASTGARSRSRAAEDEVAAAARATSKSIVARARGALPRQDRPPRRKGDELPPGVIKMVKVYIAIKRKLQVGDKMAGRHGNKGVVSRILPEEDMPYLAGRHARSTSCSTRSACRAA